MGGGILVLEERMEDCGNRENARNCRNTFRGWTKLFVSQILQILKNKFSYLEYKGLRVCQQPARARARMPVFASPDMSETILELLPFPRTIICKTSRVFRRISHQRPAMIDRRRSSARRKRAKMYIIHFS